MKALYNFDMTKKRITKKKLDGTKAKSNAGRPTAMTEKVLRKIEEAAAMDCSINEILLYADIDKTTYYTYLHQHPNFSERIERLRDTPVLAARATVVKLMRKGKSYGNAMDYLSRKRKKEFSPRADLDITHHVPKPILDALNPQPKKTEPPVDE